LSDPTKGGQKNISNYYTTQLEGLVYIVARKRYPFNKHTKTIPSKKKHTKTILVINNFFFIFQTYFLLNK